MKRGIANHTMGVRKHKNSRVPIKNSPKIIIISLAKKLINLPVIVYIPKSGTNISRMFVKKESSLLAIARKVVATLNDFDGLFMNHQYRNLWGSLNE